jgi:hypothetical protein
MEGGGAEVSWEYFREVRQVFLGPRYFLVLVLASFLPPHLSWLVVAFSWSWSYHSCTNETVFLLSFPLVSWLCISDLHFGFTFRLRRLFLVVFSSCVLQLALHFGFAFRIRLSTAQTRFCFLGLCMIWCYAVCCMLILDFSCHAVLYACVCTPFTRSTA